MGRDKTPANGERITFDVTDEQAERFNGIAQQPENAEISENELIKQLIMMANEADERRMEKGHRTPVSGCIELLEAFEAAPTETKQNVLKLLGLESMQWPGEFEED